MTGRTDGAALRVRVRHGIAGDEDLAALAVALAARARHRSALAGEVADEVADESPARRVLWRRPERASEVPLPRSWRY